jgi:site-specific recombinase XerD
MRRWDRLLDAYLEQYRARGLSEQTVEHVTQRLTDWGQWMKRCRPRPVLEGVDADLLVRYIESRSSFRAKSTVYGTISTMRGMGDHLVREGVWLSNPLRWMKGPKVTAYSRLPKRIDPSQMEALWREAASSRGQYQQQLWLTVLAMLYGTGLRRGELERLDVESFDRAEATLRIDGRKTARERCVPVPELLYRCLEGYLPKRHNVLEEAGAIGERALLVNRQGGRLSATSISGGMRRIAQRAQVPLHSVHQFRHSCASDLLEAGVHLAEVQRILGHQGIATTVRYVHLADPQRREAIERHPLNDWLRAEAA